MFNQSLDEKGNPITYEYTLEDNLLKLKTNVGAEGEIPRNMVYKSFETKSCFAVRSRENAFFIIKKDGFTQGSSDNLKEFLKLK